MNVGVGTRFGRDLLFDIQGTTGAQSAYYQSDGHERVTVPVLRGLPELQSTIETWRKKAT